MPLMSLTVELGLSLRTILGLDNKRKSQKELCSNEETGLLLKGRHLKSLLRNQSFLKYKKLQFYPYLSLWSLY